MTRHLPLFLALLLLGIWASAAPLRPQEMQLTLTALQNLANPAQIAHMTPSAGGPLNALAWWLSAHLSIDGNLARIALIGTWILPFLALRRSNVPLIALVLWAMHPPVVALLSERNHLGSAFALGALAWALTNNKNQWIAGLLSLAGAAIPTLALGFSMLAHKKPIGLLWVLLGLGAGLSLGQLSLSLQDWRLTLSSLSTGIWIVPFLILGTDRVAEQDDAALIKIFGKSVLAMGCVALGIDAPIVGGLIVCTAVLTRLPFSTVFPVLCCWGLAGSTAELTGWLILSIGLAPTLKLPERPKHWDGIPALLSWLLAFLALLPQMADTAEARENHLNDWYLQQQFLVDFHPPAAQHLYQTDPTVLADLDILLWVQGGATLEGPPPENTRPKMVGPLSGVWADLLSD